MTDKTCPKCDWSGLTPNDWAEDRCPNCGNALYDADDLFGYDEGDDYGDDECECCCPYCPCQQDAGWPGTMCSDCIDGVHQG